MTSRNDFAGHPGVNPAFAYRSPGRHADIIATAQDITTTSAGGAMDMLGAIRYCHHLK